MTKRLLELFCGTKSVGKVFSDDGYEVISLDYNKKFDATITEDILTWDYTKYSTGYFDVIWASPDCTTWSLATGGKYRTKTNIFGLNNQHQDKTNIGNNMVLKVIEIIKYFKPKSWFIENPRALLKWFPPLQDFIRESNGNMNIVYYANYNNWGFPKPTNIWSNLPLWDDEHVPEMPSNTYTFKHHHYNGKNKKYFIAYWKGNPETRSKIPPDLIKRLKMLI